MRINGAKIRERWPWMLGDSGVLTGRAGEHRWRVRVEGRTGQATVEAEGADLEMLRERAFTESDHAIARYSTSTENAGAHTQEQEGIHHIYQH